MIRTPEKPSSATGPHPKRRSARPLDFLVILALCALVVFGVVRPFVAEVFRIPSGSMTPTLQAGDRVLATKFAYRIGNPDRGDLAVFRTHSGEINIKRVAALGGDTLEIRDGVLLVNGERTREPYVDYERADSTFYGPTKVPQGHVFMLGDNRTNSLDSREYGPIPREDLLGRGILRLRPPIDLARLPSSPLASAPEDPEPREKPSDAPRREKAAEPAFSGADDLNRALQKCGADKEACLREHVEKIAPQSEFAGGRIEVSITGPAQNRYVLHYENPSMKPCEYTRLEGITESPALAYRVLIAGEGSFAPERDCLPEL